MSINPSTPVINIVINELNGILAEEQQLGAVVLEQKVNKVVHDHLLPLLAKWGTRECIDRTTVDEIIGKLRRLVSSLKEHESHQQIDILCRISNLISQKFGHYYEMGMVLENLPVGNQEEIRSTVSLFLRQIQFLLPGDSQDWLLMSFANWISNNKIPLGKLDLSFSVLEKLLPRLKHINLEGQQYTNEQLETILAEVGRRKELLVSLSENEIYQLGLTYDCLMEIAPNLYSLNYDDCPYDTDRFNNLMKNCFNLHQLTVRSHEIESISVPPSLRELNCLGCTGLTALKEAGKLRELDCSYCFNLKALQGMGELKKLKCFLCPGLTVLEGMGNLESLNCSCCRNLTILAGMRKLRELNCSGCANLIDFEGMDELRELNCFNCISLTVLDGKGKLRKLICYGCLRLKELKGMSELEKLDCSRCFALSTLERLRKLRELNCSGCRNLVVLKGMGELEILDSSYCRDLMVIEGMCKLIELDCHGCPALTILEGMGKLRKLNCSACCSLVALEGMSELEKLDCSHCRGLTVLEKMGKLRELTSSHCCKLEVLKGMYELKELHCRSCRGLSDFENISEDCIITR